MDSYYINYKICNEYLNKIEELKTQKITIDKNLVFLYVNSISISRFYNLAHPFYNNLSIEENFRVKPEIFFRKLIEYIRKSSFNSRDIILLYSLCIYYVLNKDENFKKIKINQDLKELIKDTKKVNYMLEFKESRMLDPYILDTLDKIINESYNIYNSRKILNVSLNYFKAYQRKSFFLKMKYYLFFFSKNFKKLSLYKKGLDVKYDVNDLNQEIETLFDAVTDYLFYKKQSKFEKYFNNKNN